MNTQQKIDYINSVNERFTNARNHGHNGSNWWYPQENTIAYNVKMRSFGYVESLRKVLTVRQNEYYSDEGLNNIIMQEQTNRAEMLADEIKVTEGVKSVGYAGRSGGWIEVEYVNDLGEISLNDKSEPVDIYGQDVDLDYSVKIANQLEQLESDTCEKIKEAHKNYNKYIDSEQYYKDIAETLLTDEDIADEYKGEAKDLLDKLK